MNRHLKLELLGKQAVSDQDLEVMLSKVCEQNKLD